MPGDSCISQLFSIVSEMESSFDYKPPIDVRAILLDISKAFDKEWHLYSDIWKTILIFENKERYLMVSAHPGNYPFWSTERFCFRATLTFSST